MNVTPVIPDGYNGPIKQFACRICKHLFYLTMADYERLQEVSYCHECSLILLEELERNQAPRSSISPKQAAVPASHPPEQAFAPVHRPPEPAVVSSRPSVRVPQPRTIDRHKMTVDQLLEEAKMLDKTWRYKEALASYEQALRCDRGCLAALYGKGETLRQLNRPQEALAAFEEILRLDPTAVKAAARKGWALISLRRCQFVPPARSQRLVTSGLHRNSAYLERRAALASRSDASGHSDKVPVLAWHAEQGALFSTENVLPRHGVLAWNPTVLLERYSEG